MQTQYSNLNKQQITEIALKHFSQIKRYTNLEAGKTLTSSSDMINKVIDRTEAILIDHLDEYNPDIYWEAIECIYHLRMFFKLMGQPFDNEFHNSSIGKLFNDIIDWCKNLESKQQQEFVWRMIAPAQPDTLTQIDIGVYEARWWTPVPLKDIAIIQRKRVIQVFEKPYEPENLPNGIAIQFTILKSQISMHHNELTGS